VKAVTLISSFKSFTFNLWDERRRHLVSFRDLKRLHRVAGDYSGTD